MKHKLLILLALALGLASNTRAEDVTISSAAELVAFASRVNAGETSLNATLTANIDLTGQTWTPIGNSTTAYTGTFDGQGYAITNFSYTSTGNGGLFGYIENATIKNFSIAGSIDVTGGTASGVIGYSKSSTISGIHSSLAITTSAGTAVGHVGGIVGSLNQNDNVSGCSFSGSITANANSHNCFGGIAGYMTNNDKIQNCANYGSITYSKNNCYAGGIEGYINSTSASILNSLSTGAVTYDGEGTATYGGAIVGYMKSTYSSSRFSNNYWLEGSAVKAYGSKTDEANETTASQLTSGEVCYLLNTNGTNWFQTIDTDNNPVPFSTSKRVYKTLADTYINIDGPVQIGDADDLVNFAVNINHGGTDWDAELTADIDMGSIAATWVPIGDWNTTDVASAYKGHFDGRGHEISNFNVTTSQDYYGIFGVVSAATIENFSIRGTITNSSYSNIGVIGYSRDTSVNINNIQSYLTITNNGNDKNAGGILGRGNKGTTNIDRCAFFGTINANNKTNAGGIVGYFGNYYESFVNITNCLFDGTITSENSNSYCGGIAGYGGENVANVNITNCLSLGTLTASVTGQFFGNIRNAGSSITHCYYQGDNIYGTGSSDLSTAEATAVTSEQLASGEVAYLLNGSVGGGTNWYQTLPGDANPTLDSTHGRVYVNGTVCPDTGTPQGTNVIYSNTEGTTEGSHVPVDGFCIYCGTVDANYLSANSDGFYEISNKKELVWFAALVNAGTYDAKAKLTADIDMNGADISHFPIGDASATSKYYTGTFDGQGHKLSNFQLVNTSAPTNYGMFNATTGVVLKNFWLDSSCAIEGKEMVGLIGHLYGGGRLEGIGNCADVTGIQNNIGGLIGGVTGNSGSKKNITIKNCWTTGKVTTNPSANKAKDCGALTGWFNNAIISIEGFWTVADVANPTSANTYVYRNGAGASFTISNSFSKNGEQANYTNFTDEQLANGWLCYGLNGNQSNIAWYQTIGTDSNPVLDSSSEKVLYVGAAGYSTMYDAANGWKLVGDAKAYIGTINGSALHLDEIADIPAGTAVVISGTYYNKVSTAATATTTGNVLKGSNGSVTGGEGIYALAIMNEKVGFYPVAASVTIPAGKAYLEYTSTGGGAVKGFTFVFDDATGINEELRMMNEESSEVIYNVAGQRLSKMQKGINIVNGKKIMVKQEM